MAAGCQLDGTRRAGEAGIEVAEERRSSGGAQLEEGDFVPPKPGVFPPQPRPKAGAARVEEDIRVEAGTEEVVSMDGEDGSGVGYEYWGGSEGGWESVGSEERAWLEKEEADGKGDAGGGGEQVVEEEVVEGEEVEEYSGGFEGPLGGFVMGLGGESRAGGFRKVNI